MNKDKNPIPDYYNFGPYQRVAPRDLFNEAKLLKCLGKVALGILDNRLQLKEVFINPENGFEILQNEDGDIMCNNYYVLKGKKLIYLFSRLNSRLNWPLMTMTDDEEIIEVFDEDGNFTEEFLACVSDNKKKDNPSPKDESFIPPEKVAKEAIKGLEFRKTYGRGGTEVGLKRAHQLKNRENLSPKTILRMYSFFARHGVHEGMNFKENGEPTNHYIAWLLWGGDAGRDWAARMRAKIIKGNNPLIDAEIETEIIKGGRGDSIPDSKFDKTQLNRGIKVEMEHTNNTSIAKEIAKDHLIEDPQYYEKLSKIHKEMNPLGRQNNISIEDEKNYYFYLRFFWSGNIPTLIDSYLVEAEAQEVSYSVEKIQDLVKNKSPESITGSYPSCVSLYILNFNLPKSYFTSKDTALSYYKNTLKYFLDNNGSGYFIKLDIYDGYLSPKELMQILEKLIDDITITKSDKIHLRVYNSKDKVNNYSAGDELLIHKSLDTLTENQYKNLAVYLRSVKSSWGKFKVNKNKKENPRPLPHSGTVVFTYKDNPIYTSDKTNEILKKLKIDPTKNVKTYLSYLLLEAVHNNPLSNGTLLRKIITAHLRSEQIELESPISNVELYGGLDELYKLKLVSKPNHGRDYLITESGRLFLIELKNYTIDLARSLSQIKVENIKLKKDNPFKENPRPLPHSGTVVFTYEDGSGDIMGIDGKILPFTPDVVCELSKTPKKGDKVKFSTYDNLYSSMIDYLIVINERENKLKPIKDFLKREDDQ